MPMCCASYPKYINWFKLRFNSLYSAEEKDLQTWLYDRYQEKEEMIERFKEKGIYFFIFHGLEIILGMMESLLSHL